MQHWRQTLVLSLLITPALVRAEDTKQAYPPPAQVKEAFLKLLDRPRVPLDVRVQETKPSDGLVTERISFASERKPSGEMERVPMLLIHSSSIGDQKQPAVLVLHGTGGSKEGLRELLVELAKHGFVAAAIDGRYHGERAAGPRGAAYNDAITQAWRSKPGQPQEHPFYYDTCWDIWRTIDYLVSRKDVDPARLGLIGFSKGGIETWLAAAVDERIKVAVPAIAVQSFRWSLENERWQARANTIKKAHEAAAKDLGEPAINARVCRALWNKIIPGILDQFDCPSMLRLFAGRPLLILSGELDANCPIEGANLACAVCRQAYDAVGAGDRLKIMVAKGVGHSVTKEQREAALAWFEKWLKD